MRALVVKGLADAPVVADVPEPVLTDPDQVLVRVQAASLSRLDSYTVRGWLDSVMEIIYPIGLGWDFAGVVAARVEDPAGDGAQEQQHQQDRQRAAAPAEPVAAAAPGRRQVARGDPHGGRQ